MADIRVLNSDEDPGDKKDGVVLRTDESSGYLQFPFDKDQFREFFQGLLGQPQSISKVIKGYFEVNNNDIHNLYQIIDQRISQQNDGILASFGATVRFSDESSVALVGINDFMSYNEVRAVYCEGIHLQWDYLVHFRDKNVPEKQTIIVSYIRSLREYGAMEADEILGRITTLRDEGIIPFRIEHTARTWGADMESILSNHLDNLIIKDSFWRKFAKSYSSLIGLLCGLGSLIIFTVGMIANNNIYTANRIKSMNAAIGPEVEGVTALDAVRYFASEVMSGAAQTHGLSMSIIFFVAFMSSISIGLIVSITANNSIPSFILFNKESEKNMASVKKKHSRNNLTFALSVIASLSLGVISNLIYSWLFNK